MEEFQTDVREALKSQAGKIEDVRVEARQAAEAQHTRLEHVEKYQVLQALAAIRKQQNLNRAVTLTLRVREQLDIAIEDQLPCIVTPLAANHYHVEMRNRFEAIIDGPVLSADAAIIAHHFLLPPPSNIRSSVKMHISEYNHLPTPPFPTPQRPPSEPLPKAPPSLIPDYSTTISNSILMTSPASDHLSPTNTKELLDAVTITLSKLPSSESADHGMLAYSSLIPDSSATISNSILMTSTASDHLSPTNTKELLDAVTITLSKLPYSADHGMLAYSSLDAAKSLIGMAELLLSTPSA